MKFEQLNKMINCDHLDADIP